MMSFPLHKRREPRALFGVGHVLRRAFCRVREGGASGGSEATAEVSRSPSEEAERAVLCAACGHTVSRADASFAAFGATTHTFMNPAGFVFEIVCYREAPGAIAVGPTSSEWSWFPGHSWTIALCAGCRGHLGWRFEGDNAPFFGLVTDRIVER